MKPSVYRTGLCYFRGFIDQKLFKLSGETETRSERQ